MINKTFINNLFESFHKFLLNVMFIGYLREIKSASWMKLRLRALLL